MSAAPPASPYVVCDASKWTPLSDTGARSMASDGRIVHEPLARVLDVGCGNGSLLLALGAQWPAAPVRPWGPRIWPCLREDGAVAAGRQA